MTSEPTVAESVPTAPRHPLLGWTGFWIALFLATLPIMVRYFYGLWDLEHYRFFPFVLGAVAMLAYSRSDKVLYPPRNGWAWGAIGLGGLMLVAAMALASPWVGAIGFVLISAALLGSLRGDEDTSLIALVLPLALVIRLPLGYDQLVIFSLQGITTRLASVVLDVVSIPHSTAGNVIQLASRELFVAEACSGIQSVFTLAFLACMLVVLFRRAILLAPLYVLVACCLAVAANVLRVSMVAGGDAWFEMDLASGLPHELVGYVALAIGAGLLLSFDQLVIALLHPLSAVDEHSEINPLISVWNWMVSPRGAGTMWGRSSSVNELGSPQSPWQWRLTTGVIAASLVMMLASIVPAYSMRRPGTGEVDDVGLEGAFANGLMYSPAANEFEGLFETLKVVSHEVVRDGSNIRLGKNADVWMCEVGGVPAQLVLSQTYRGWHELCFCYEGGGWQLLDRQMDTLIDESSGEEKSLAKALFTKTASGIGQLYYGGITAAGDEVEPPPRPGRFTTRFLDPQYDERLASDMIMFQLWVVTPERLDVETSNKIKRDYVRARSKIADEVRGRGKGKGSQSHRDTGGEEAQGEAEPGLIEYKPAALARDAQPSLAGQFVDLTQDVASRVSRWP